MNTALQWSNSTAVSGKAGDELPSKIEGGEGEIIPLPALNLVREAVAPSHLCFQAGRSRFAFRHEDVHEIVLAHDIVFVPGAPDFLPGFVNVRGRFASVLDLSRLFGGIATTVRPDSFLLFLSVDGITVCVLTESTPIPVQRESLGVNIPLESTRLDGESGSNHDANDPPTFLAAARSIVHNPRLEAMLQAV